MARLKGELIANKWQILKELQPIGEIARYLVTDKKTGENWELHEPTSSSRVRPGTKTAFKKSLSTELSGNAVKRIVVETPDGAVAIAPLLEGSFSDDIDLSFDQAFKLIHWLGPTLKDYPPIYPYEIVITKDNIPLFAPTGISPNKSVLQQDYYNKFDALYSLGVFIFRSVTGAWPSDNLKASTLEPTIPEDLDKLISSLLSPNRNNRLEAISSKTWEGSPLILPIKTSSQTTNPQIPVTQLTTYKPKQGPIKIVVMANELSSSAKSLVAARALINPEKANNSLLQIGAVSTQSEAEELVAKFTDLGINASIAKNDSLKPILIGSGLSGIISSAIAGIVGLFTLPLVLIPIAILFFLMGIGLSIYGFTRNKSPLFGYSGTKHEIPQIQNLLNRAENLQAKLVDLELSAPEARDFRDDLFKLKDQIINIGNALLDLNHTLIGLDPKIKTELNQTKTELEKEIKDTESVLTEFEYLFIKKANPESDHFNREEMAKRLEISKKSAKELSRKQLQ